MPLAGAKRPSVDHSLKHFAPFCMHVQGSGAMSPVMAASDMAAASCPLESLWSRELRACQDGRAALFTYQYHQTLDSDPHGPPSQNSCYLSGVVCPPSPVKVLSGITRIRPVFNGSTAVPVINMRSCGILRACQCMVDMHLNGI